MNVYCRFIYPNVLNFMLVLFNARFEMMAVVAHVFSFIYPKVVDIMKTNVEKVLERDQKLSELDDRADALQQGASQFEQQAGKLKRKFWLQNLKMMIIMGVIGLVIVAIIACEYEFNWAFCNSNKNDDTDDSPPFGFISHNFSQIHGQWSSSTTISISTTTSTTTSPTSKSRQWW